MDTNSNFKVIQRKVKVVFAQLSRVNQAINIVYCATLLILRGSKNPIKLKHCKN